MITGEAMIWLALGVVAAVAAGGWWVSGHLRIATVDGPSMLPTFRHGDRVLVRRVRASVLRPGDVVMVAMAGVAHPVPAGSRPARNPQRFLLKRIAALPGDPVPAGVPVTAPPSAAVDSCARRDPPALVPPGMLVLLGDNPDQSIDSRDFGCVPSVRLFGVVVRRLG